jgi:hypothetical protein
MSRRHVRLCAALAATCAALLGAGSAAAQRSSIPDTNWRQRDRPALRNNRPHSIWTFEFELRFGPYYPEVDEEFNGAAAPYAEILNDNAQFYFGVEVDWLPFRIPYVGAIGPGIGWGFTTASAEAKKVVEPSAPSGVDTSLTIMPMHLSAVLRVDEIMRRTIIPVVPYVKFGVGMAMWDMSEGGETARYIRQSDNQEVLARALSWGTHFALGGMLGLNWLSSRSSASIEDTLGIRNTYIFGEWMYANLDGIGSTPQLHAGTSTWVLGLALEM